MIGTMEKLEAHRKGVLHRAFSVFVFNGNNEMLLQQRASTKYHSGGLWTNACCSHPRPKEATEEAAKRRLLEELGFVAPLMKIFDFTYYAAFANGLIEHEFDHVYVARYSGLIDPNPAEVMNFHFKSVVDIWEDLTAYPETFTEWFTIAFPRVVKWMETTKGHLYC